MDSDFKNYLKRLRHPRFAFYSFLQFIKALYRKIKRSTSSNNHFNEFTLIEKYRRRVLNNLFIKINVIPVEFTKKFQIKLVNEYKEIKTLNDWHIRFENEVHVLRNNDAFRSTWNYKKLNIIKLLAWHFHGLKIINKKLVQLHSEKIMPENIISEIYMPYLKILEKNVKTLNFNVYQRNNNKNILLKFLTNLNLYLVEKKLIKNPRYFIF